MQVPVALTKAWVDHWINYRPCAFSNGPQLNADFQVISYSYKSDEFANLVWLGLYCASTEYEIPNEETRLWMQVESLGCGGQGLPNYIIGPRPWRISHQTLRLCSYGSSEGKGHRPGARCRMVLVRYSRQTNRLWSCESNDTGCNDGGQYNPKKCYILTLKPAFALATSVNKYQLNQARPPPITQVSYIFFEIASSWSV
jgi:hypothetical protein